MNFLFLLAMLITQSLFVWAQENTDAEVSYEGMASDAFCSGSLFIYEGQSIDAKAKILTNGHCLSEGLDVGDYILNLEYPYQDSYIFNKSGDKFRSGADRILYATTTDTDIAIYQLKATYREIYKKYQISPLILSSSRPKKGDLIEITLPKHKRRLTCEIEDFISKVKYQNYRFIFRDTMSFGCKTFPGTSGAPMVAKGERKIIGVSNSGGMSKKTFYGQQTYRIYTCLNKNFEIDLSLWGCRLPKKRKVDFP